jgi:hypothetical protein
VEMGKSQTQASQALEAVHSAAQRATVKHEHDVARLQTELTSARATAAHDLARLEAAAREQRQVSVAAQAKAENHAWEEQQARLAATRQAELELETERMARLVATSDAERARAHERLALVTAMGEQAPKVAALLRSSTLTLHEDVSAAAKRRWRSTRGMSATLQARAKHPPTAHQRVARWAPGWHATAAIATALAVAARRCCRRRLSGGQQLRQRCSENTCALRLPWPRRAASIRQPTHSTNSGYHGLPRGTPRHQLLSKRSGRKRKADRLP